MKRDGGCLRVPLPFDSNGSLIMGVYLTSVSFSGGALAHSSRLSARLTELFVFISVFYSGDCVVKYLLSTTLFHTLVLNVVCVLRRKLTVVIDLSFGEDQWVETMKTYLE